MVPRFAVALPVIGRGLGVIALRDLGQDELVLTEEPVLAHHHGKYTGMFDFAQEEYLSLLSEFTQLPVDKQEAVLALANRKGRGSTVLAPFMRDPMRAQTLAQLFATNAFSPDDAHVSGRHASSNSKRRTEGGGQERNHMCASSGVRLSRQSSAYEKGT